MTELFNYPTKNEVTRVIHNAVDYLNELHHLDVTISGNIYCYCPAGTCYSAEVTLIFPLEAYNPAASARRSASCNFSFRWEWFRYASFKQYADIGDIKQIREHVPENLSEEDAATLRIAYKILLCAQRAMAGKRIDN